MGFSIFSKEKSSRKAQSKKLPKEQKKKKIA
jgi:hypothetical protein